MKADASAVLFGARESVLNLATATALNAALAAAGEQPTPKIDLPALVEELFKVATSMGFSNYSSRGTDAPTAVANALRLAVTSLTGPRANLAVQAFTSYYAEIAKTAPRML